MKNSGEWGFETYLVMSHKRAPVAFHQPTETKHYASKKKVGIEESKISPLQKKRQALKNLKIKELKHQNQQFLHITSIVYSNDV